MIVFNGFKILMAQFLYLWIHNGKMKIVIMFVTEARKTVWMNWKMWGGGFIGDYFV